MNYFSYLLERTGGALVVNVELYSQLLGVMPQTVYNQLSANKFPFRRVKIGRKIGIRVEDLAHFLETGLVPNKDATRDTNLDQIEQRRNVRRGPGRPPKLKNGAA